MMLQRHPRRLATTLALIVLVFAASACTEATPTSTATPEQATTTTLVVEAAPQPDGVAAVFAEPTFEVVVTEDVVYAQGLSHDAWGSNAVETMDLLLDVYEPVRSDDTVMPAIVMIHGGGFTGGSKSTRWISQWGPWFAERG